MRNSREHTSVRPLFSPDSKCQPVLPFSSLSAYRLSHLGFARRIVGFVVRTFVRDDDGEEACIADTTRVTSASRRMRWICENACYYPHNTRTRHRVAGKKLTGGRRKTRYSRGGEGGGRCEGLADRIEVGAASRETSEGHDFSRGTRFVSLVARECRRRFFPS